MNEPLPASMQLTAALAIHVYALDEAIAKLSQASGGDRQVLLLECLQTAKNRATQDSPEQLQQMLLRMLAVGHQLS